MASEKPTTSSPAPSSPTGDDAEESPVMPERPSKTVDVKYVVGGRGKPQSYDGDDAAVSDEPSDEALMQRTVAANPLFGPFKEGELDEVRHMLTHPSCVVHGQSLTGAEFVVWSQFRQIEALKRHIRKERAALLAKDAPADGWISVKERFPEKGQDALCLDDEGEFRVARFIGEPSSEAWFVAGDYVNTRSGKTRFTHWRELPASPAAPEKPQADVIDMTTPFDAPARMERARQEHEAEQATKAMEELANTPEFQAELKATVQQEVQAYRDLFYALVGRYPTNAELVAADVVRD